MAPTWFRRCSPCMRGSATRTCRCSSPRCRSRRTSGGNLREILDGLATVIRERGKLRRKVRAISTEGRMSAYILTAIPALLMVGIMVLMPQFYSERLGQAEDLVPARRLGDLAADRQRHDVQDVELQVLSAMHSIIEFLASLRPTSMMPVALLMLVGGAAAVGWPLLSSGRRPQRREAAAQGRHRDRAGEGGSAAQEERQRRAREGGADRAGILLPRAIRKTSRGCA